ncbi:MAG: hypothetical protein AAGE80_01510 [Pseudomonadota bacterium]
MTENKHTPEQIADSDLDDAQGAGPTFRTTVQTGAEDKLGNFEIQDLMSRFNQAETLASSVQKKTDDTKNAVIGKIA